MTQPLLAIIADDLTGALDAAAPFAASRGGVVVATHPAALDAALARTPDIVSISTRSREIAPEVARDIVAGVLAALPPGTPVLKKIDSRMKGNIAAELEAFGEGPKLVIPAIPDLGRVVRDGALVGFGADEPIPIRPALGRFADNAIVPDIADAADIAWAVAAAPSGTVFVGARGLTQALAEARGLGPPPDCPTLPKPVCIAVGSTDPITLAQVAMLRRTRPETAFVAAPNGAVSAKPDATLRPVTLLQATPGPQAQPADVATRFAQGSADWLRRAATLVLTGGATAEAILDRLEIEVLTVQGEALPGMPYCRAGAQGIVTKSGGFGGPDAFVQLTE